MQIDELNILTQLFDLYGNLLSNKQRAVMDKFLNLDIGESELAELMGETRQSIHDAIAKAKKQLYLIEQKCQFAKISSDAKQKLTEVKTFLQTTDKKLDDVSKMIDDVISLL